jgi:NAD+-dependent secondary alcohol dehydrogenase Adh1
MEHHLFHRSSYDGGMASFLKTTARAVVKLDPSLGRPKDIAALADAGLTAYHAVKKSIPDLYPGTKVVDLMNGAAPTGGCTIHQINPRKTLYLLSPPTSSTVLKQARIVGSYFKKRFATR